MTRVCRTTVTLEWRCGDGAMIVDDKPNRYAIETLNRAAPLLWGGWPRN